MGYLVDRSVKNRLLVLSFLILFIVKSLIFFDPDFGWHIRFGELVLRTHAIIYKDQFSYSMPSYYFVNHEWLVDTLQALLLPLIQRFGLAIVFSCLAALSLLCSLSLSNHKKYSLPIIFIAGTSYLSYIGIRDQVVSLLLFSVLLIFLYGSFKKYLYLLPFLFFLWANLHGAFVLGLIVICIYTISVFIERREAPWRLITISMISILATLVNPYGVSLWIEIVKSSLQPSTREIVEWMPLLSDMNLSTSFILALSFFSLIFLKGIPILSQKIILFLLLLLSLAQARHLPFLVIFYIPILPTQIAIFEDSLKGIPHAKERFRMAYRLFTVIVITVLIPQIVFIFRDSYSLSEKIYYPKEAVMFLSSHSAHHIFAPYNWGGYILYKLPSSKVFIDGRMPHWQQAPKEGESSDAFTESTLIYDGEIPVERSIQKYKIDTFVLQGTPSSNKYLLLQLQKLTWKEVYKDQTSIVYQKWVILPSWHKG